MPEMLATSGWLRSAPHQAAVFALYVSIALSLAGVLASTVAVSLASKHMPYSLSMLCNNETDFDQHQM